MGTCMSKKRRSSDAGDVVTPGTMPDVKCINNGGTASEQWGKKTQLKNGNREKEAKKELKDENPIVVKKDVFVIRPRNSYDRSSDQTQQHISPVTPQAEGAPPTVSGDLGKIRTSSCTKEEVDAILIQCGRLSRSSSKANHGRKYSGSKRSFDFDNSDKDALAAAAVDDGDDRRNTHLAENDDDGDGLERRLRHRQRNRQSPRPSPSRERRRTPSRERDQNSLRERRVSRSPGRRSSETSGNSGVDTITNISNHDGSRKPAKMVSVPATVTSLAMAKSNNGCDSISASAIKRVSVKRNAGDQATRVVSSPRSQSPAKITANGKVSDENLQQHQPSLSRSSSRKAEQSPYRRNALSEIDPNCIPHSQELNRNGGKSKKETESDGILTINALNQKPKVEAGKGPAMAEPKTREEQTTKVQPWIPEPAEPEKPQTLTRTRSARRSRDLDMNLDTSYTTLLLEDIHNFHQKNPIPVSLPPCLTKACSILEAVADLNSTTSSNLSSTFSGDRTNPASFGANLIGTWPVNKDPFVESEVAVEDDVTEPSFHKYITITRGDGDGEDQESSGSNSLSACPQIRASSKCVNSNEEGKPNSARPRNGRPRTENVRVKERLVPINRL